MHPQGNMFRAAAVAAALLAVFQRRTVLDVNPGSYRQAYEMRPESRR